MLHYINICKQTQNNMTFFTYISKTNKNNNGLHIKYLNTKKMTKIIILHLSNIINNINF